MDQEKSQQKQEMFLSTCILYKFYDFVVGFGNYIRNTMFNYLETVINKLSTSFNKTIIGLIEIQKNLNS